MQHATIPSSWHGGAHELWLTGKKSDAIQLLLKSINANNEPVGQLSQFGFYLFFLGDYKSAIYEGQGELRDEFAEGLEDEELDEALDHEASVVI